MKVRVGRGVLELVRGDITTAPVDAIGNAANRHLAGGGGVDGAIHRAGGPEIMAECDRIRAEKGGCPTGSAVVTVGGRLPARWVLHAVGPVWRGGAQGEAELLASAYRDSLRRAAEVGARSVAFPSISTGIYGYPVGEAAKIALATVAEVLQSASGPVEHVTFYLFDEGTLSAYEAALRELEHDERGRA